MLDMAFDVLRGLADNLLMQAMDFPVVFHGHLIVCDHALLRAKQCLTNQSTSSTGLS